MLMLLQFESEGSSSSRALSPRLRFAVMELDIYKQDVKPWEFQLSFIALCHVK